MSTIIYIGLCFIGYLIAIPMRKHKDRFSWLGMVQNVAVLLLVSTMGMSIGSSKEVVSNIGSYGLYALIFTLVIVALSILGASLIRRLLGIDKYGQMASKALEGSLDQDMVQVEEEGGGPDIFTILLAVCVIGGILAGYLFFGSKEVVSPRVGETISTLISVELCVLLVFVGIDMGLTGEVVENFKQVGIRVLIIPAAVCVASLIGAFITGKLLAIPTNESLAIGASMGWYSLGAALMIDAGYLAGGAICFLHCVMREFIALIIIPLVANKVGYVEAAAFPGAPAMDVCLPVISKATRGQAVVYGFITGLALSILVPILVPLFL
ncbi:MAG: lysine exporter LysO family protein [Tissierellia bacterium]|nr:lysine exporter LysO family protein [Tissierellia bacterium]